MGFRSRGRSAAPPPWQRSTVTGLDLGSTAVRAVVLGQASRSVTARPGRPAIHTPPRAGTDRAGSARQTGAPAARRVGSIPLPPGAIVGGVVLEPRTVTAALRQLVAQHGLRGHRVVLGIGTPHLVVRPLTLPAMPSDELRRALPFQARDVLPIPVADAVLDFSPLPRPGPPVTSGPVDGMLTAAPKAAVLAGVQAVQASGLTVARVDLSPFGLLRSIGSPGPVVEALVDIGAELTTIVIHRHGVPHVVRVIAFGGRRLTDRVADALGVPTAEAEAAKRAVGVVGDSMPALQLRDELRPLLAELRASLRYFVGTVGSSVDQALLTGGTAGLPGLPGLLADELDVRVGLTSPLRHLADGPDGAGSLAGGWSGSRGGPVPGGAGGSGDEAGGGPASAVAVGLALGLPSGTGSGSTAGASRKAGAAA